MSGPKLSFSFSKKIEKKSLQPSAIGNDQPEAPKNTAQVIESIDENIIQTNEKEEEAKELVIPLVKVDRSILFKKLAEKREQEKEENQKNELEEDKKSTGKESPGSSEDKKEEEVEKPLSLDEQAALEVIKDSKRVLEQLENEGSVKNASLQIELAETSVDARESSVHDYEKINVESIGAAMLRGMGWRKAGGVGTKRKVVEVVDPDKKGLSLSMNHMEKPVTQASEEELELKPSAHVVILNGRNRGVYGTVQTVDEDHLLIRPARNSSNILREVEFNVRVVTKQEFKDSGRVINKEMYDEYKKKGMVSKKRRKSASSSSSSSDKSSSEEDSKTRKEVDAKFKDEPYKSEKVKEEKVKSETGRNNEDSVEMLKERIKHDKTETRKEVDTKFKDEPSKSEKVKDKKVKTETGRNIEDDVEMLKERIKKHDNTEVEMYHSKLANKKEDSLERISESKGTSENVQTDSKKRDRERDREYSKSSYRERDWEYSKSANNEHSKKTSDKQDKYDMDRREEKYTSSKRRDDYGDSKSKRKYDEEQGRETKYSSRDGHSSSKDHKSRHKEEKYAKEKYKDKFAKEKEEKSKKSRLEDKPVVVPWVRENLRVRFINKNYKGGRYYKEKVVVLNVLTAENCECITEEGKVLREVNPTWLETVIPKAQPRLVQVVQGKHKGLMGLILEQHKDQEKASIQVIGDEQVILKLHYDDICEIVKTSRFHT